MSLLSFADALAIEGGALELANLPEPIPPQLVASALATLNAAGQGFEVAMERAKRRLPCASVLTPSTSPRCSVRPLAEGLHAIFVPVGVVARLHVTARVLLRYWGKERRIRTHQSPLDPSQWDPKCVPPHLRPLLLEYDEPREFWRDLAVLDANVAPSLADRDAEELTHLALQFLLAHEFAHVLNGHFELLERAEREDLGLGQLELLRGVEADADATAAALSMLLLNDAVVAALRRGEPAQFELGWLRLSYAVTMLFGVTDAQRRYFGAYRDCEYSHPTVRSEVASFAAYQSMEPRGREAWQQQDAQGLERCVQAFDDLLLDSMAGLYGELEVEPHRCAVHNMHHGMSLLGPTQRALFDARQEALGDAERVRALLPLFADRNARAQKR